MEVSDQLEVTGQMVCPPGGPEDEICSHERGHGSTGHARQQEEEELLTVGLQTTASKCPTEEPPSQPISAEKVNCSWPEVRNWKEADTNSHKSRRINISFFRGRVFFFILVEDKGGFFKYLILCLKAKSIAIQCRPEPKNKQGVRAS